MNLPEDLQNPKPDEAIYIDMICEGGADYCWSEFRLYKNPISKQMAYVESSGCSCNSWDDAYKTFEDLTICTYDECKAAATEFVNVDKDRGISEVDVVDLMRKFAAASTVVLK